MSTKTPKFGIALLSDHAVHGLAFSQHTSIDDVDSLFESALLVVAECEKTQEFFSQHRLMSARLACLEMKLQTIAEKEFPPLAQYPSVAKDTATFMLPYLEKEWSLSKSEPL